VSRIEALAPLLLLVALLAAVVAIALIARRSDVPASVVFVVVGLGVAIAGPGVSVPVAPELLLAIVLPGLVFEAAFRTDLDALRPSAAPILLLAVPGVVIVAAIVAAVLALTSVLPLGEAFVVGAMVAATDPAAVLTTFRHVPVPARLATTVEMESLVNDGTGIALFGLSLDLLLRGGSVDGAIAAFVVSVGGAVVLGGVLGWIVARLIARIEDAVTELTITVVLAYGTYLLATVVGASGVIATLVAAGVFGVQSRGRLTARARESIDLVWEFIAFLLTAFVFLLVGLAIAPSSLSNAVGPIAAGIVAVLIARAVVVYGLLGGASRLLGDRAPGRGPTAADGATTFAPIPLAWLHVLFWAGLRGAVSVALALSLPPDLPNRPLLQAITFGVVLFTLLVQGTTAPWVVRRTGAGTHAGGAEAARSTAGEATSRS
jgi:CPA1 family monovalent cation:H+ antiporter